MDSMGVAEKVGSQVRESGHLPSSPTAFDCIVLSLDRKFLSRKRCQDWNDTAHFVQAILQKDIVGSLSIKRVVPRGHPN